jgi:geranylgeranyl diphosphate synthase, type II
MGSSKKSNLTTPGCAPHASHPLTHYPLPMQQQINSQLEKILHQQAQQGVPTGLIDAARYALMSPGKRLRPLLLLAQVDPIERGLQAACAVECLHTYSLIHDDLPCMDDDDFRRGQPSCHKAFSEATALLTGDYLLTLAFQLLAEDTSLSPQQRIDCIQVLGAAAGGAGMVGGQLLDSDWQSTLEQLNMTAHCKTAALIAAAVEMGAIIAQADRIRRRQFGQLMGLAFQVADDLQDMDQDGSKATYPSLLGEAGARQLAQQLLQQALQLMDPDSPLANLAQQMVQERHMAATC